MKVLLSAYACEPNKGSEPGVGWNWAIEIARLGHKVWVLTRANNQPSIDSERFNLPKRIISISYTMTYPAGRVGIKEAKRGHISIMFYGSLEHIFLLRKFIERRILTLFITLLLV